MRWPDSSPEQARPRLHTAAHYARRALGDPSSVMLHDVVLTLLPQAEVDLDVERFLRPARAAMSSRSAADVDAALAAQGGPLLPEDLFGPWAEADRERLQQLHQDVLRGGRRWNDLLQLEPADEQAHLELMRAHAARGDRRGALQQFERLDRALRQARSGRGTSARVSGASAHLARAEGDDGGSHRLLQGAADRFDACGQSLDARRCRTALPRRSPRPRWAGASTCPPADAARPSPGPPGVGRSGQRRASTAAGVARHRSVIQLPWKPSGTRAGR